jgi:hypothetical protein
MLLLHFLVILAAIAALIRKRRGEESQDARERVRTMCIDDSIWQKGLSLLGYGATESTGGVGTVLLEPVRQQTEHVF